jgi:glyoxylase-like metal-dependent hydrolase (beta-lactamase superfamily II)
MNIGNYKLDLIDTGIFALDGGAMFGVVPKALWAKAYHPGDEINRIPLSARPLLVRTEGKNILIDTGNGTKMSDKLVKIYNIDLEKSDISKGLAAHGLTADDITDVIFTHLHFDHSGGATRLENGQVVPTFPNARHYVQKEHYEWALNPNDKDKASFFNENYEPLFSAGMLELVEGRGELFKGIEVLPVYGHTKAMQMIKINGDEQTFLYCADVCPTSAHVNVPFVMGYDNHPLITIEEKKKILPEAYEESWILVFEHDAFSQAGTVKSGDKGFSFGDKVIITNE